MKQYLKTLFFLPLILWGCRGDELIFISESTQVTVAEFSEIDGFYLLNEGNMGSNSATLDYMDYKTGVYKKNIYPEINPTVVKELGDVGNDLEIYGNKLYAVINCSHKVEIMDATTTKRITHIDIPNCRYLAFDGGYAYVSSYVGPIKIEPNAPLGAVFKVDTVTMQVVDTVTVGYQPEEMEVRFGKLYVANSGGYRKPNYDRTVSVIDLKTFREIKKIDVAINLHRLKGDRFGNLYVSSRGDYYNVPSKIYVIDARSDRVTHSFDMAASNFCIVGDSAYVYSAEWNWTTAKNTVAYGIIDLKHQKIVNRNFITDGTDARIKVPYGIAVNPLSRDIYITDAKNYVIPGILYCFGLDGVLKWKVTTGNIPAHFAFKGKIHDKNYEYETQLSL